MTNTGNPEPSSVRHGRIGIPRVCGSAAEQDKRFDQGVWLVVCESAVADFLVGYLPFFLVSFHVHDLNTVGKKAAVLYIIYGVNTVSALVFGVIPGGS